MKKKRQKSVSFAFYKYFVLWNSPFCSKTEFLTWICCEMPHWKFTKTDYFFVKYLIRDFLGVVVVVVVEFTLGKNVTVFFLKSCHAT